MWFERLRRRLAASRLLSSIDPEVCAFDEPHDRETVAKCEEAIRLAPNYGKAWTVKGMVLTSLHCTRPYYARTRSYDYARYKEARAAFRRGAELGHENHGQQIEAARRWKLAADGVVEALLKEAVDSLRGRVPDLLSPKDRAAWERAAGVIAQQHVREDRERRDRAASQEASLAERKAAASPDKETRRRAYRMMKNRHEKEAADDLARGIKARMLTPAEIKLIEEFDESRARELRTRGHTSMASVSQWDVIKKRIELKHAESKKASEEPEERFREGQLRKAQEMVRGQEEALRRRAEEEIRAELEQPRRWAAEISSWLAQLGEPP